MTPPDLLSRTFWTRMLTAIGLGTGTIVGVAQAWPFIDPYLLAHRGFVVDRITEAQAPVRDLQMWRLEDGKKQSKGEADNWTIQLQKESDPNTRGLIQRRIDQLNIESEGYDQRLRSMRR